MKKLLKATLLATFISSLLMTQATFARTVEVDVHGMTCAFCVDSLERKFNKMETVSKVEVSLKLKKIRLETDATLPTVETIKQAVLDTGFTPVKVTVLADDATSDATASENAVDATEVAPNEAIIPESNTNTDKTGATNVDKKEN